MVGVKDVFHGLMSSSRIEELPERLVQFREGIGVGVGDWGRRLRCWGRLKLFLLGSHFLEASLPVEVGFTSANAEIIQGSLLCSCNGFRWWRVFGPFFKLRIGVTEARRFTTPITGVTFVLCRNCNDVQIRALVGPSSTVVVMIVTGGRKIPYTCTTFSKHCRHRQLTFLTRQNHSFFQ